MDPNRDLLSLDNLNCNDDALVIDSNCPTSQRKRIDTAKDPKKKHRTPTYMRLQLVCNKVQTLEALSNNFDLKNIFIDRGPTRRRSISDDCPLFNYSKRRTRTQPKKLQSSKTGFVFEHLMASMTIDAAKKTALAAPEPDLKNITPQAKREKFKKSEAASSSSPERDPFSMMKNQFDSQMAQQSPGSSPKRNTLTKKIESPRKLGNNLQ